MKTNPIDSREIQCWTCDECENDMSITMYVRTPWVGILLECSGCDREVEVHGEHFEIRV